jgi:replicative DNA helicase
MYDKMAVLQVIGSLVQKPELLLDDKYQLSIDEFPERFHQIVFSAISNLINSGINTLGVIEIDNYISSYEKQYKIYNDNNGMEYLENAIALSIINNFDYNYNRIKKFSLINQFKDSGFDIKEIYDENVIDTKTQEKMQQEFDQMDVNDIINYFDKKIIDIKAQYYDEEGQIGQQAGKGMEDLINELKETPEMGVPVNGSILNTIVRGARLKKLYMKSSPTGFAKCIVGNSYIFTNKGIVKIEDIPVNYCVKNDLCQANIVSYEVNNGEQKILPTSHWFNMGVSKTIKIKTSQGYELEGTPEHPIVIMNKQGQLQFKKLKDIINTDIIAISTNNNLWGSEEIDLDIAYLLGVLIGDGYLNRENTTQNHNEISYTKNDENMYTKINNIFLTKFGVNPTERIKTTEKSLSISHVVNDINIKTLLKNKYGLSMTKSPNKTIPKPILQSNKKSIRAFLQGLFDTDGCMSNGEFEYTTASKELSTQVHLLLLNFGIKSSLKEKIIKKYPNNKYYKIFISDVDVLKSFEKEIGFKYCIHKKEILNKRIQTKESNTNINLIYHQKNNLQLLHQMILKSDKYPEYIYSNHYKLYCKDEKYRTFESARTSNTINANGFTRQISKNCLQNIINSLELNNDLITYLKNISTNFFFDVIDTISNQENIVYDFTVPETHSFVSNGFISHNTRGAVADACCIGVSHLYNMETNQWETNGFSEPVLFITTELEISEIQTIMNAYISGVDEAHILDGKYEEGEEERVNRATKYIEDAPLYIEQIPNFNIEDIERTVKRYKLNKNIGYVFFDYVFMSVKMLIEIATKSKGMKLREDNILYIFTDRMKFLCNKLNIHFNTSSQLNGEWKNTKDGDQNLLRGSKAIADKLDVGIISLPVTKKDLEMLHPILSRGFYKEPNMVYHIYKLRKGKFNKVKLWLYFDFSNARSYEQFVTTNDYELIPIESTTVEKILEMTEDKEDIDEEENEDKIPFVF